MPKKIRDTTAYLIDTWGDTIAEKFTDELIHATLLLEKMPYMGEPHPELSSVRQLIVKPSPIRCFITPFWEIQSSFSIL
jgi:plasmid stabilization system protein ParE